LNGANQAFLHQHISILCCFLLALENKNNGKKNILTCILWKTAFFVEEIGAFLEKKQWLYEIL